MFVCLAILPGRQGWALDDETTRATLKGLVGLEIGVGALAAEIEQGGITTKQLQSEAEQLLRSAGIPVFTAQEARERPEVAFFAISVTTLSHDVGVYAYSIDLAVYQDAALARDATPLSLPTWSVGSIGIVDMSDTRAIINSVHSHINQFIQAYQSVQPRASDRSTTAARTRIRQVQERLRAAGFRPGPVDGKLGPRTRNALRQYQHTKGLRSTGTLDRKTLKALGIR
jgi:hypothetical protein